MSSFYPEMAKLPGMSYIGMVSRPNGTWPKEFTGRVTDCEPYLPISAGSKLISTCVAMVK